MKIPSKVDIRIYLEGKGEKMRIRSRSHDGGEIECFGEEVKGKVMWLEEENIERSLEGCRR